MRKIVSSIILLTFLGTGLYADCSFNKEHKGYMKDKSYKYLKSGHFLKIFRELNLSSEQNDKIRIIIENSRKSNKSINEAFAKDSFDKAKYIKIVNEKRESMIKSRAEIIEKSYAILTPKQKEQLKILLDLRAGNE